MEIDLSLLHSNNLDNIDITGEYELPKLYYENSNIIKLEKVKVNGTIERNDDSTDKIICTIEGTMIIPDSISLEEIKYDYNIKFDDIIADSMKKSENILDIFEFLWENIVLEVPLQFTKVDDLGKFHGDGWKLISEDELKVANNPFSDLLKDFDKE